MKKQILFFALLIIFSSVTYSISLNMYSEYGFYYSGLSTYSQTMTTPLHWNMKSFYLNVTETISGNITCYQEFANSTYGCSECSCYDTGIYQWEGVGWNADYYLTADGDWTTNGSSSPSASFRMNYTKPSRALGAIWQVGGTNASHVQIHNLTIPEDCFDLYPDKLRLEAQAQTPLQSQWFCFNTTTSYKLLFTIAYNQNNIYEEGIFWIMENSTIHNYYIDDKLAATGPNSSEYTLELNHSLINDILDGGCSCSSCVLYENGDCDFDLSVEPIPPPNDGSIAITFTNTTYEYGIDECSNTVFNYTILNISFYDQDNLSQILAANTYISFVNSPYDYLITGDITTRLYDGFCTNINLSQRGEVLELWGSMVISADNYKTNVIQTDVTFPYVVATSPATDMYIYLISNATASEVEFTIKDVVTINPITNALARMFLYINGTPVLVGSKLSDVSGKIVFDYIPDAHYLINFSKTGYSPLTSDFNPITSATYDIFLAPYDPPDIDNIFDRVSFSVQPQIYYNGVNNFNFTIVSFYGELTYYNYTLTYPGGTTNNSGSNNWGEKLSSNITIVGATIFDQVQLDIIFSMPIFGTQSLTYFYPIGNKTDGTLLHPSGGDPTYGMGLIERLLIVVFGALLIMGLCVLGGQEIPGIFMQGLWGGYWAYVKFVPLWAFLPSIFIAVIMISWRSQ